MTNPYLLPGDHVIVRYPDGSEEISVVVLDDPDGPDYRDCGIPLETLVRLEP